jgi:hypothetical protein
MFQGYFHHRARYYLMNSLQVSLYTAEGNSINFIRLEISIIFAAGPFCCGDDLAYTPLFDLLDEVRKKPPTLLILSGPFLDIENETPTPKVKIALRLFITFLVSISHTPRFVQNYGKPLPKG